MLLFFFLWQFSVCRKRNPTGTVATDDLVRLLVFSVLPRIKAKRYRDFFWNQEDNLYWNLLHKSACVIEDLNMTSLFLRLLSLKVYNKKRLPAEPTKQNQSKLAINAYSEAVTEQLWIFSETHIQTVKATELNFPRSYKEFEFNDAFLWQICARYLQMVTKRPVALFAVYYCIWFFKWTIIPLHTNRFIFVGARLLLKQTENNIAISLRSKDNCRKRISRHRGSRENAAARINKNIHLQGQLQRKHTHIFKGKALGTRLGFPVALFKVMYLPICTKHSALFILYELRYQRKYLEQRKTLGGYRLWNLLG